MKIGDKVIINKILPLTATGGYKPIKIDSEIDPFVDQVNIDLFSGETTIEQRKPMKGEKHLITEKVTKSNGNTVFKIKKVNIKEKEGILVGFIKKKLEREYTNQNNEHRVSLRSLVRKDRNTRSPNRVDNFRKLDTVALVSISDYRIVAVDLKDIVNNNIKVI